MIAILVGAIVGFFTSWLAQWPSAPQHFWYRYSFQKARGRKCYMLPGKKTHVVPCVTGPRESPYVSRYGLECVSEVTQMLRKCGLDEGHDFDVIFQQPDEEKSEDFRRQNLILVCGPERNGLVRSVLQSFPDLLHSVTYKPGSPAAFLYRDVRYVADSKNDWALVAVKRNPYNRQRKLIMLFGLRGIGTLAAGSFFASSNAHEQRLTIAKSLENTEGEIEILLRVEHSNYKTIIHTCPVDLLPTHGLRVIDSRTLLPKAEEESVGVPSP